ncbi:MAG: MBL fold metallo-hydrolase [Bacteroidales bacterium]|nr:MBL fold metallo-hydrolase [Bacteroidales bacterium]
MLIVDYIVNSVFNSRTYILSEDGSDKVWLVDCGDVEPVMSIVGSRKVEGVLLTHAHFDHIYGLPSLLERFPDVAIYTNGWGKRALADDRMNLSRYHDAPVCVECPNVRIVSEGEKVCGLDVFVPRRLRCS